MLLTDRQVANILKAFSNNLSTDVKFSKIQLLKMMQSGGFLENLLSKFAGPLMKVAMPLAKNVLAPLGLTAAMSAIDRSINKKMLGEGIKKKSNLLIPFHPLTNFEIREYYENEPRFNGVYSRDNFPGKIKKGAYIINFDEYEDAGTHWIDLIDFTNLFSPYDFKKNDKIIKDIIINQKI